MSLSLRLGCGFAFAATGLILWTIEWRGGMHALALPVYLCLAGAWIFFAKALPGLAMRLHHAWRSCFALWLVLSLGTLACLVAVVPLRTWLAIRANDGMRRWYHEGMPFPESDYPDWLAAWQSGWHLRFEAAVFALFFAVLLIPCAFSTRRRFVWGGLAAGIALLAIAPLAGGILAPDYDQFMLGIALDSVGMSIWPLGIAYGDAHLVFPLGFLAMGLGIFLIFERVQGHFLNRSTPPADGGGVNPREDRKPGRDDDPYRPPLS